MVLGRILLIAGLLIAATVAQAAETVHYERSLYKHWIDADHDCQNTRQEVLIIESVVAVTLDATGCKVLRGRWLDPYTGKVFTDPRKLHIDHFIPLAEVHRSGGYQWDAERRRSYANDLFAPSTLIAVAAGANSSKGARDPAKWMPPNEAFHCQYVMSWVEVKTRWGLLMDPKERSKVRAVLAKCSDVAPPFSDATPSLVVPRPGVVSPDVIQPPGNISRPIQPPRATHDPVRPPRYGQGCDCPYDRKSNGYRCGRTSAYSRPDGRSPVCYADD